MEESTEVKTVNKVRPSV